VVCFNSRRHFVSKLCKELEVSSRKTYVVYLRSQRSLFQSSCSCLGRKLWEALPCCRSSETNRKIKWSETPDMVAAKIHIFHTHTQKDSQDNWLCKSKMLQARCLYEWGCGTLLRQFFCDNAKGAGSLFVLLYPHFCRV